MSEGMFGEQIPGSWLTTKLGSAVEYGKCEKIDPENIGGEQWVLELEDVEKDTSRIIQRSYNSERQSKSTKNVFQKGDVLYGKLRPYLNKVVMADSGGVCTTEIIPLSGGKHLENRYLFYWLKHPGLHAHHRHLPPAIVPKPSLSSRSCDASFARPPTPRRSKLKTCPRKLPQTVRVRRN